MRVSLVALACLAGISGAQAETVLKTGNLTADVRTILVVNNDGNETANALGFGANALYNHTVNDTFRLGVGIAFGAPLTESDDGIAARELNVELSESGKSSDFFSLNQLFVHYVQPQYDLKAGRMVLDTPLAGSDNEWRLNKNSFEALLGIYRPSAELTTVAAYIRSFSGIDSYAFNSDGTTARDDFNSMSDAAFGAALYNKDQVDNAGVIALAAVFAAETLKTQFWAYYMPEIEITTLKTGLNAAYADLEWHNDEGLGLGLQAYHIGFTQDFDTATHSVGGLKIEQKKVAGVLDIALAANMVSGDGAIMNLWGAYPEYAAGSEVFLTGLSDGFAAKLALSMDTRTMMENSRLNLNIMMMNGDMTTYGADSSTLYGELALAYKPTPEWSTQAAVVARSGDAEGYKAVVKATYAF